MTDTGKNLRADLAKRRKRIAASRLVVTSLPREDIIAKAFASAVRAMKAAEHRLLGESSSDD